MNIKNTLKVYNSRIFKTYYTLLLYSMGKIILGSKRYDSIDITSIIDTFEPIRHNFQIPDNNNGTKFGTYVLNNHVWVWSQKNITEILRKYGENMEDPWEREHNGTVPDNHLIKWKKYIDNNIKTILPQTNNWHIMNEFLKKINCPYLFKALPRIGYLSFMEKIMENEKPYLFGFSIDKINDNHQYSSHIKNEYQIKNIIKLYCHDVESEMLILLWLHQNNFIDATLCSLVDTPDITFDCKILKPTNEMIKIALRYFDEITLINLEKISDIINYKDFFKINYKNKNIILKNF